MGSCIEGRWQQCLAFAEWAHSSPDVVVLNTAISTWSMNSWPSAVNALSSMTQQTFQPNAVSYGAAVTRGAWGVAAWLLVVSYQQTLGSSVACSAAVSACEKRSRWHMALSLLTASAINSLQCSIVCFNAAASACEKGMKWQATLALLQTSAHASMQPNMITYNAAISAGKQTSQWIQALHSFLQLRCKFNPDTITCNSIIASFDRIAGWRQALELVASLFRFELEANVVTFGSSMGTCAKAKQWQQALSLFTQSEHLRVQTDAVMYNALLRGSPWPIAIHLLSKMRTVALQASVLTHDVIMQACSNEGKQEDVWQLFVSTAAERSALEYLWGLALLSCSESDVLHKASVEASVEFANSEDFAANELACLWWSIGMLGVRNPRLDLLLTNETACHIGEFELDELVTTVLGAMTSSFSPVLFLSQRQVEKRFQQLSIDSFMLTNLGMHVLGIVFSCHLSQCLSQAFLKSVQLTLSKTGRKLDKLNKRIEIDSQRQPNILRVPKPESFGPQVAQVALDLPTIPFRLPDRAVLLKPPDWEVYGGHVDRQLLSFAKANFGHAPIFFDASHFCGFLHRLDVPSSGLILMSFTYEAHYDLQVQLHAGQIHRDYLALSHGMIPASRVSVIASVVWHGDGPTFAGGRGRTARTHIHTKRYATDTRLRAFSHLEVQIATGRKHQIRSHLAHAGFPVVGDGTYASYDTFWLDREITTRHWLHRHRVTFSVGKRGKRQEVESNVPQDLVQSLGRLRFLNLSMRKKD